MKQIKYFALLLFSVIINNTTFSQTSLNLINSYSISDDVEEPSGLAFDKFNNQLFSVSDTGNIYRLSNTGNLLETYNLSGDLEGVSTYNTPNTLLVAIEDTYEIIEYNYVTGSQTSHTMDYDNQGDTGSGIEGVTYNSNTGEIYFLNEKDPGALIVANSNFNVTDEYELTYAGDYSASYYVEETNELWLGSDNSSALYRCNTDGSVIESFDLTLDGDELDKIEGIAIDHANQLLYIVTDGGGDLLVYNINTETVDEILNISSINNFSAEENSQTIDITSNVNWTVNENTSWITLNRTSGSNNGSVIITSLENTSTSSRSATVNISGFGITRSVSIFQNGADNTSNSLFTSIPALIQAEDFDLQSGIRTENTSDNGNGENVGYIDTNDFLTYNINVPKSGDYTIDFRVASRRNGTNFDILSENNVIGSISSDATGGWQTWETISETVTLTQGNQTIRLLATTSGWNINWLEFSEADDNPDSQPSSNCTAGTNLAENATIANFSTQENTTNAAENINDGNPNNRWSAITFPQSIVIDLGSNFDINEINLIPFRERAYQFIVEGSTSSATTGFSTLTDARDNTFGGNNINRTFTSTNARYIKLTVTGASGYTGPWTSIMEFDILCAGTTSAKGITQKTVTDPITEIKAYPNPFTNTINIITETNDPITLTLMDMVGNIIKKEKVNNNTSLSNLDNLANGIYFLQIINTNTQITKTQKLIKE